MAKGEESWPAELAAVVERYAAGESGETIAADLGLDQSRVYSLLRERACFGRSAKQVFCERNGGGVGVTWIGRLN